MSTRVSEDSVSFSFCSQAGCGCSGTLSGSGSSWGADIVSFVSLSSTVSVTYTPGGRRNVRFFLGHILHGNLRGCRSLHVGCYCKDGNIVRRVAASGYVVGYRPVSGTRGSLGLASPLRGGYHRTRLVLSQAALVFRSSVLETAPSLGSV